jgi:hypothetical protein
MEEWADRRGRIERDAVPMHIEQAAAKRRLSPGQRLPLGGQPAAPHPLHHLARHLRALRAPLLGGRQFGSGADRPAADACRAIPPR